MQITKCLPLLVTLLFSVSVLAQAEEDAVKEKKARLNAIVEGTLADIQNLRLPENRAFFYCRVGNVIWLQDQKRARSLFHNAGTELVNAQAYAESKRSANPYNELLTGANTRQQILNTIAIRDAEVALELLVRTRPAAIERAMLNSADKTTKISNAYGNNIHLVQNENYMEQTFYRMAAEQSPDRAVKLLKESLSKGFSNETFNQLNRLVEKDADVAAEMATQVVSKLLRVSYIADEQPLYINIQLTQAVLSHHISRQNGDGNKLRFDETQMRDLAAKFISAYVSDRRTAPYIGPSVLQIAEKLQPSSIEKIKKATAQMNPHNVNSEVDAAYQKLLQNDTPVEQMLASADKFPLSNRRQIYQTASNKMMAQGNWQAAREVLSENFDDADRDQMLVNFDQQNVWNLINQSKFTDAERVIDTLPSEHRVAALVNLSNTVFSRDPKENKAYAFALLEKARQLTNEKPENSGEMGNLMQIIGGFGNVDPAEAIRLYEGVIPKIIELTDAAAVLNGFQTNSNVRDSEFIMTHGDPFNNYGANASMIGAFAKFDFDRTMKLVDSFTRQEMRVSLRLQLLDGSEIVSSAQITGRASVPINVPRRGH